MRTRLAALGIARLALLRPKLCRLLANTKDPTGNLELLCEAYEEASQALDGWRQSPDIYASLRVVEYQQLIEELEGDIEGYLLQR